MEVGTKVITSFGLFGVIGSIGEGLDIHGATRQIAYVILDNSEQTLGYWMDTVRKRKPKPPIKLKKFSAWK